jgi:hypothetical protein
MDPANNRLILAFLAFLMLGIAGNQVAKPHLTSFQQCVQAFEQNPNDFTDQVVPSVPGCQAIPAQQAQIEALFDAVRHDNPANVQPWPNS